MKYIIAIGILVFLFSLYILVYLCNSKTDKPENCKKVDCGACNLTCHKRSEE